MAWFATSAAVAAANGLYYGVKYAGEAIGGAVGYGLMQNTPENFRNAGAAIGGPALGAVGGFLGRGAAGLAVNTAVDQARSISTAVNALADAGFALHSQNAATTTIITNAATDLSDKKVEQLEAAPQQITLVQPPQTTWKQVAWQATKVAAAIGVGAGAVALGAGVLAPLAISAANAIPEVAGALAEQAANPANVSLVGDVVTPFTTQMAIAGISTLAGGVATYNYIESAHDARIIQGARIGGVIDSWMPNGVKGYFTSAGRVAGTVDAGRHAMSDAVVSKAVQAGANTKTVVESGLKITNAIVKNNMGTAEPEAGGWGQTARKAGWVVGGALAAGGFALIAPEAAAVAGGAALLSVAAPFARYAKAKMMGSAEEAPVAEDEKAVEAEEVKTDEAPTENESATQEAALPGEVYESLTASKLADSVDVKEAMNFLNAQPEGDIQEKSWAVLSTSAAAA